ncbi:MAG: family 16 glycosylhydrolase [Ferruginibacter sp.]
MKSGTLLMAICFFTLFSCSKKGTSSPNGNPPANLVLNAIVSQDNSGIVNFTATATNAVVYTFNYGDNATEVTTTGVVSHRYTATGLYTVTVTAKSSTNQTASATKTINVSVTAGLVWSDEFDGSGLPDPNKWSFETGAGGWGNNEVQNYTNRIDNASVSGGTLKITAKAESFGGSSYTSARLVTKGKYSFKYGKIEASIKLPTGVGTWPAFWMLGDNVNTTPWPACGEIDIMEHLGRQLNVIYSTLHHPGHSGSNGDGSTTTISGATTSFHKYTAEWSSSNIKFYVDDVLFYNFANSSNLPFNANFFIILNMALGGNFGGPLDPAFTSAVMEIDYVRVYQ